MPDDEPLDEARAVGTAAAAAAARVAETVARHVSETEARERANLDLARDQRTAQQALGQVDQQVSQRSGSTERAELASGERVEHGYDSTEQRGRRDAAREEAGVPVESRRVVAVADQMNGQDPTLAAAVGKAQRTKTKVSAPVTDRSRGR